MAHPKKYRYTLLMNLGLTLNKDNGIIHLVDTISRTGLCPDSKKYQYIIPDEEELIKVYEYLEENPPKDISVLGDIEVAQIYCSYIHYRLSYRNSNGDDTFFNICGNCMQKLYNTK